MHCKSLWIKASAKCINVNVNNVSDDSEMSTLNSNISTFLIFPKAFPLTQLDSQILQSGSYYI